MAISTETRIVTFAGSGGLPTVFAVPFTFQLAADLAVYRDDVLLTLGVGYSVATPSSLGGTDGVVTLTAGLGVGEELRVERSVDFTQDTNFRTQGSFSPETHETQFDRVVYQTQELLDRVKDLESAGAPGSVVAGSGLSFAGATLNVGAGPGIISNADDVEVEFGVAGEMLTVAAVGSNGAGSIDKAARIDHFHDVAVDAPIALVAGGGNVTGSPVTLALSNHRHAAPVGAPVAVDAAAAVTGASGQFSDAAHKHQVTTGTAIEITDSTNGAGAATSLAKSDHQHAHGNRGGGSLHAEATNAVAGFMSAADKTTMERLSAIAHCRVQANTAQIFLAGAPTGVVQFDNKVAAGLYDPGNHFNTTTFRFTAPRTGYYKVTFNLQFSKSGGGAWVAGDSIGMSLYKNGATFLWEGADSRAHAAVSIGQNVAGDATLYLTAGDYLEVKGGASGASDFAVSKGYLHIDELA